ncbi:MAG: hypothetical protein J5988_13550, partial [Eubacterium sp.]|nr:hypothetical protein [Eubacterium sp.]
MRRLAKKIGAIIMVMSMVLSVTAPFSLFVVSEAAGGQSHGTDRSRAVSEKDVNNTPPQDYVIPERTQAKAKEGLYNSYFLKDDLQTV